MKQAITIPIEHQALICTALKKTTGKAERDMITPLTRGMSGANIYKVEVNDTVYVARISNKNHPNHWGGILKDEFSNMLKASSANVSPKVYFSDSDTGIVLMQYINPQPLKELEAGNKQHAGSLADLILQVHRCSKFNSSSSFIEITQRLVQHLNSQHPLVSQSGALLESIEKILSDPEDLRPSHRDMNPYNVLFNGNRYYLVDWEAAAQDTLYLDLATCVNYFFYDNIDTARYFLEQYFGGALSEEQQHKLHLMRIVSLIYSGTNFLLLVSKSTQPLLSMEKCDRLPSYAEYMKLIGVSKNLSDPLVQEEYGLVCFKEALRLVNHPDYSAAMEKLMDSGPGQKK